LSPVNAGFQIGSGFLAAIAVGSVCAAGDPQVIMRLASPDTLVGAAQQLPSG